MNVHPEPTVLPHDDGSNGCEHDEERNPMELPANFSDNPSHIQFPSDGSGKHVPSFLLQSRPSQPSRSRRNQSATTATSSAVSDDDSDSRISEPCSSKKIPLTVFSHLSKNSITDASQASQTSTIKRSNAIDSCEHLDSTGIRSQSIYDDNDDVQEVDEESSQSSSVRDDDTRGGKSLVSSIFATLAPLRSWRDITLGEIVDALCSIFPKVTSGDISSLAQVFFDNLSTVLASLYAIQELAKIQPTATTTTDSNYVTDPSMDKTVSLSTMNAILFESVAPGLGLALFFGNTYYTWMAARKRREFGRDYTALPTGMSTPYAFFMVFNIIYPIYYQERSKDNVSGNEAFLTAYRVSLAANFVSGMISVGFGMIGPWILRVVPPHVLLIPAAGICIAFLGLEQITKCFSAPIVGLNALFWVYLSWYANVRIGWGNWRLPEALQVLLVGVILGWATGLNEQSQVQEAAQQVGWIGPHWAGSELWSDDFARIQEFLGLIIPLGLTAPMLSLMCLVSSKEAGDPYPVRETLIVDGIGTILASMFGCPFGIVVYIGHPSHTRSGALISSSYLNGILYLICSWFGLLGVIQAIVNPAAVGPIVFLVGLYVNEDVLDLLAPRHFAAYILGILPSICDWAVTVSGKTPVQDIDPDGNGYNTQLLGSSSNWYGLLALKHGSLLISFFWTAIVVKTIDRKWRQLTVWSLTAALFSLFGLIHSPQAGFAYLNQTHWEQCDATSNECWMYSDQWMFVTAYMMIAATSLLVHCLKRCDSTIRDEIDDNHSTMAFENWFADASKPTFAAEDKRCQSRSYLPAIREIQQFQREALQSSNQEGVDLLEEPPPQDHPPLSDTMEMDTTSTRNVQE